MLRLLRQLVSNVNGTADCSSRSSNICNGASRLDHKIPSPGSCTYPDLLSFLGKPKSTGKRSQKNKRKARNATCERSLKQFRTQGLPNDAKVGIAMKGTRGNTVSYKGGHNAVCFHEDNSSTLLDITLGWGAPFSSAIQSEKEGNIPVNDKKSFPPILEPHTDNKCMSVAPFTSDRNCAMHEYTETVLVPVDLAAVVERGDDPFEDRNNLHSRSPNFANCFVNETNIPQEQSKLVAFEKPELTFVDSKLSEVSKKLVRIYDLSPLC